MRLAFLCAFLASATPVADRAQREVRFTATVQPDAMDRMFGVKGHHAIVWKGGRAKRWALFAADVSDHDVRVALDSIGARRGENLKPEAWTRREDPSNPEPDRRVEGTPIQVLVSWKGSPGAVPLSTLISEEKQTAPRFDFRYGGNEAWQKEFRSGCIVCLYSCPGGAIGNHAHSIRDYVRDGVVYASLPNRLPPAGTKVTIILRIAKEI
jgi:hypothetical protein